MASASCGWVRSSSDRRLRSDQLVSFLPAERCGRGEYPKKVVRSSGPNVYRGLGRQICRQLPVRKASTRQVRQRWPTKFATKFLLSPPPGGFQAVTSVTSRMNIGFCDDRRKG